MSVYRENRGPDWGAALQSLAQGLQGYSQQKYQEQRDALERQRQIDDLAEQRKYQEDLWNKQNAYRESLDPFVSTPPQDLSAAIDPMGLSSGSSIPLGTTPGWFPGLPSEPVRMRQSDLNSARINYGVDQENFRQQQALQSQQEAAALERTNAAAQARATATAAREQGKNSVWGDISKDAFDAIVNAGVAKEEIDLMGPGFKSAVYNKLLDYAGNGFTIDAAAEAQAEREVRQSFDPTFQYGGGPLSYAPSVQDERGVGGRWYNDQLYGYTPPKENWGWLKDRKGELNARTVEGTVATNAQALPVLTNENFARDFLAPALEKGYITVDQLNRLAKKTGVPFEELRKWIPDALSKAAAAEQLGSAMSKRAVASETAPTTINWDEIK